MVKQNNIEIIVVLDRIRSAFNVGTILRTADCLGIKKIYFCGYTPPPEGKNLSKIAKVSLGAEKTVDWQKVKQTARLINKLKKERYYIIALENTVYGLKKTSIDKFFLPKSKNKVAMILGNEIKGISKSILLKADKIIEIPLFGQKQSLNVAVAFAIAGYFLKLKK